MTSPSPGSTPAPRSMPAPRSTEASPRTQPAPGHTNTPAIPHRPLGPTTANAFKPSFIPAWRRPTLALDGIDSSNPRRPSVQFVPQLSKDGVPGGGGSRSSSAKPPTLRSKSYGGIGAGAASRRMSSPPPPAQFRPSVSFDTFSNPAASVFSLTLNRKHRDYEYTKRSRTFLVGTDTNEYSDTALEWLIDELVDDGDEVVCLRVVEKDSKEAAKWSGVQGEKGYRQEAERFLEGIVAKNTEDRAISLVLEFSIGKIQDAIQQMIRIYEPAILVVGTRGRSLTGYQGLLTSGSVSKYCLQYSPVPVIVVRPSSKREKKKRKRLRDPSRTGYRDILDKSDDAPRGRGGHLLDERNRSSVVGSDLGALGQFAGSGDPDEEARRVAEAIGFKEGKGSLGDRDGRGSSLSRVTSGQSNASVRSADDGYSPPDDATSITRLLKSPELRNVDSPMPSDEEVSDDEDVYERLQESVRPEDEAAILAYERAMKIVEEEREEAEARRKREEERAARGQKRAGRSTSKGPRVEDDDATGSNVLELLAQLDRGMK